MVYRFAMILACAVGLSACITPAEVRRSAAVDATHTALARICEIDGAPIGSDCPEPPADPRRAVIEVNPDALKIAEALTCSREASPLCGMPIMLKANIDTGDQMTTTAGAHAMAGFRAAEDATLVDRLRKAGVVVVGKTNLSEWANFRSNDSISGWSGLGGQTTHAVDTTRNPCGSSSGSAVAVAIGLVPLAIGTETDGSIVCPSAINGIVGIKPTLGLISRFGVIPIAHSQDTAGPMAKDVKTAALGLAAMAGRDERDAATAAIPDGMLPLAFEFSSDALVGKRIGVLRSFYGSGEVEAVEQAFSSALETLRRAGAVLVDPVTIDTTGMSDAEYTVLLYEFKADLNAYLAERQAPMRSLDEVIAFNVANPEKAMPFFGQDILELASQKGDLDEAAYLTARRVSRSIARDGLDQLFERLGLDAIVAPTNGPAWLTDYENGDSFAVGSSSLAAVSGYPSVTVPVGEADGLPLGMSLIGRAWRDATLVELAFAFERAHALTKKADTSSD
ncbi:MAG: amidase [Pseudomonadota bacterium]